MGKRAVKENNPGLHGVNRDGELCAAGLSFADAEIFVSESSPAYPEATFKIIPQPKRGRKEVST